VGKVFRVLDSLLGFRQRPASSRSLIN
jgi:hypothetical protein